MMPITRHKHTNSAVFMVGSVVVVAFPTGSVAASSVAPPPPPLVGRPAWPL
jgi:hypothetical protein